MPHRPSFKAAFLLAAALGGCVEHVPVRPADSGPPPVPPPLKTEPIGVQMTRAEPRLVGTPFRVLLDFERPTDTAFLVPHGGACQTSPDAAHTGQASLKLDAGAAVDVKLHSLLSGSAFPGTWTFAGAYFRLASPGQAPTRITLSYHAPGTTDQAILHRTLEITDAQHWTPVLLDLTPLTAGGSTDIGQLAMQVEGGAVYCDDVLVLNNFREFQVPPPTAAPGVGWTIRQVGSDISVERLGRFRIACKTPEADLDGWTLEEANELRVRLASVAGHHWTVYLEGRQYLDAQFSALVAMMGHATEYYAEQHASPAEMVVPDEFGRVDRDTPGDQNNDGYNERRGAYELAAHGTRFEVAIRPHAIPLVRPVLEITGLAAGDALITVEGHLVEEYTRLPNGTLLVEMPMALRRPTTVNITIR
jgi:hypothetical protein